MTLRAHAGEGHLVRGEVSDQELRVEKDEGGARDARRAAARREKAARRDAESMQRRWRDQHRRAGGIRDDAVLGEEGPGRFPFERLAVRPVATRSLHRRGSRGVGDGKTARIGRCPGRSSHRSDHYEDRQARSNADTRPLDHDLRLPAVADEIHDSNASEAQSEASGSSPGEDLAVSQSPWLWPLVNRAQLLALRNSMIVLASSAVKFARTRMWCTATSHSASL